MNRKKILVIIRMNKYIIRKIKTKRKDKYTHTFTDKMGKSIKKPKLDFYIAPAYNNVKINLIDQEKQNLSAKVFLKAIKENKLCYEELYKFETLKNGLLKKPKNKPIKSWWRVYHFTKDL